MDVALLAIIDEGVRLPELIQDGQGEGEGVVQVRKGEALVHPGLPEVTVHREGLQEEMHTLLECGQFF